jgi:glycine/D-amino acid oxidase-like deaminating enzyme
MSQNKIIDFLIVGQGLAGSIIANEIHTRGSSFQIIDNNHHKSASMAAGGIMHPMSFKRMIESWNSLEFIHFASKYYSQLETELNAQFFEAFSLKRPFGSIEEQNDWMGKMKQDGFNDWMGVCQEEIKGIHQPYGIGEVFPSGKINVGSFLALIKTKFSNHIKLEVFNFDNLELTQDGVNYQGQRYSKVIFCEGYQYINNPYFSYLPNNVTKGELIEIKTKSLARELISKGCFIAPHEAQNMFTVGSTYVWDSTDDQITEQGKNELIEKLSKVGLSDYQITAQKCGIRPTTHDRRPLVGNHPAHEQLFIFNGMGSKTVMMAPLLASQLLDQMEGKGEVMVEASIERLEKKHFHKYKGYERAKM